ncbi:hypothetical protein Y032_0094g2721 [Ancylostoma ceylanicum]|uniref:Uncharacterized protein n=1 Tax=Ancylostoma ceylanicum TaxID=53326 RepID=A0A016TL48_9BILA|nr:hypothetical protein Y032_0094g2721 [Ancylostoma ceylanicum]
MQPFASLSTGRIANHMSFDRRLRGLQLCLHRFRQRPRLASLTQSRNDGAVEQFSIKLVCTAKSTVPPLDLPITSSAPSFRKDCTQSCVRAQANCSKAIGTMRKCANVTVAFC